MSTEETILRRKALLDALMPDDEQRHLWLTHAGFYNAINTLARLLPIWVDGLYDLARNGDPIGIPRELPQ